MSIAVNAAGLLVSAVGALSPVVAAILHNACSVAVVANSSRLIRYRIPTTALSSPGTGSPPTAHPDQRRSASGRERPGHEMDPRESLDQLR